MTQYFNGIRAHLLGVVAAVIITAGVMTPTASAQDEGPNTGAISLNVSADVYTEYWFRGIYQEDSGFIFQPSATVTVDLFEGDGWNLSGYASTWNSLHSGDSGSSGSDAWYESDFSGGLTLSVGDFAADVAYVVLYGPNSGGAFAHEVDVTLRYDDTSLWPEDLLPGWGGLQPYILFAFETDEDTGSDGQGNKATGLGDPGIYMEIGIEPSFLLLDNETYPITFSVPMTVGIGIDDYYEYTDVNGNFTDEDFGFFSVGAHFSMPLTFVPAEYGAWSVWAGVDVIILNEDYIEGTMGTNEDTTRVVGGAGFSIDY